MFCHWLALWWQSCWREFFCITARGKRKHPDPFLSFPRVTLYQSSSQASCLPPHHGIRWIRVPEPKVSIQSPDKGRRGYDSSTFFNSLLTSAFLLRLSFVEWNRPCWHYQGFLTRFWLLLCFIIAVEWLIDSSLPQIESGTVHAQKYLLLRCPWESTVWILCGFVHPVMTVYPIITPTHQAPPLFQGHEM